MEVYSPPTLRENTEKTGLTTAILYAILNKPKHVQELIKYIIEYYHLVHQPVPPLKKGCVETTFHELITLQYLSWDNGRYYLTKKGEVLLYSSLGSLPP